MKKAISLYCFLILTNTVFAQKEVRNADGSYFKQCSHFEISKPLWQLAKEHPAIFRKSKEHKEARDGANRHPWKNVANSNLTFQVDPVMQTEQGTAKGTGTPINVEGTNSVAGYDPLDPSGMAGTNYYVQAVNSNYQVFHKNGTAATAPIDLATLFPGSLDDGDPVVMYDKFADRWVITEFLCPINNCSKLLFAISTTNDPTGSYYLYTFEPDVNDNADYPKYSIWSDGYYETCNCDFQKVTVYDRTKMLAGNPNAGFIVIPAIDAPNNSFWCPQTLFADGQLPTFGDPQFMFYFTDDAWGGGLQDQIHIYKITTNWTANTGAFIPYDSLTTLPFNSYFTGGNMKNIAQPGTNKKLDALEGIISYRIPYLRWTDHNTALFSHAINTGSQVAGVRWYELRQNLTSKKWSIYQQGTYAPSDGVSRWNPGIGMDNNGSIGLAYSVSSSSSVYPGIRYTGRNKCDTLGKMTLAETTAIAGASNWTSDNRWGDYSQTTLDPSDGVTFWHTNQYMATGQNLTTRIFTFQVPTCPSGIENMQGNNTNLTATAIGNNTIAVNATNLPSNSKLELTFFDNQGKLIEQRPVFPTNFILSINLQLQEMAAGMYYIRIGNSDFMKVVKIMVP